MSSSSDIEKLFDHFGGDANAYQEIGRENEARSARTRWPLLVTLDLSQPLIPAIGQRREARPQSPAAGSPVAVDRQDSAPKDAASVTRAKAPLFTRSHRRDIPPVAVAATAGAPRGASRFGAFAPKDEAAPQAAVGAARADAAAPEAARTEPAASGVAVPGALASVPPAAPASPAAAPITPAFAAPLSVRPVIPLRTPAAQTVPAAASSWTQAPAPVRAYTAAPSISSTPPAVTAPAAPPQPASILGKLFAPQPGPTPPRPAAPSGGPARLQSIFDRLRGTPAQTATAPAGTAPAATPRPSNSWLVNGPRRS